MDRPIPSHRKRGGVFVEGLARVFLHVPGDPEPCPHPGYRGFVVTDARGCQLVMAFGVEYLGPAVELPAGVADRAAGWMTTAPTPLAAEWEAVENENDILLPWHRIDQIEWLLDESPER